MRDLRTRQQDAEVERAWRELWVKRKPAIGVAPTGAGKTRIYAKLAERFYTKTSKPILIVTPQRNLIEHTVEEIQKFTSLTISVEMANRRATTDTPVVCATVQSMCRRLKNFERNRFSLVIFDEVDLAAAKSWEMIRHHFKAKLYGATATPDRLDGKKLFAKPHRVATLREMIEKGQLAHLTQTTVAIKDASLLKAKRKGGDFDEKWLSEIFSREQHLHEVVKPLLEKAGDRPTLVFAVSVLHAKLLAKLFNRYRPGCAEWVSGKMKNAEGRLAAFKRGEFQFLCNCSLIQRGVDVPAIACIGMARPTMSRTLYLQMLGRGTRPAPNKQDCLVIDFTFNTDMHPLDAVDALSDEKRRDVGLRVRERVGNGGEAIDVIDMINEVEAELEGNKKLRERIQTQIEFELLMVARIPELRKRKIKLFYNKHKRFPRPYAVNTDEKRLGERVGAYCNERSDCYDATFAFWCKKRGYGNRLEKADLNKSRIKAFYKKHKRLPSAYAKDTDEKYLGTHMSNYVKKGKTKFSEWCRARGYGSWIGSSTNNKQQIKDFYKKQKRFPRSDSKYVSGEEKRLGKALRGYCSPATDTYNENFNMWCRKRKYGNALKQRTDLNRKQIKAFYKKHKRFPSRHIISEKQLAGRMINYCSQSSDCYNADFDLWCRNRGYGSSLNQHKATSNRADPECPRTPSHSARRNSRQTPPPSSQQTRSRTAPRPRTPRRPKETT